MSLDKVDVVYNTSTVMNEASGNTTHLTQIHNVADCILTMVLGVVNSLAGSYHMLRIQEGRSQRPSLLISAACSGESGKGGLDIRLWKVIRNSVAKTLSRISESVKDEFKKRFGIFEVAQ